MATAITFRDAHGKYQKLPTNDLEEGRFSERKPALPDLEAGNIGRTPKTSKKADEREQYRERASSFESYAFISALLFGFSCMALKWDNGDYTVFRDAQLSRDEERWSSDEPLRAKMYLGSTYEARWDTYELVFLVHMLLMTVGCSMSMYSTVVFSLSGVYIRTALAINRIDPLTEFLKSLQRQRDFAFKAFVIAASLLPGDVILVTFANLLQHGHGTVITLALLVPGSAVVGTSSAHIRAIMNVAGETIFNFGPPPPPVAASEPSTALSSCRSLANSPRSERD